MAGSVNHGFRDVPRFPAGRRKFALPFPATRAIPQGMGIPHAWRKLQSAAKGLFRPPVGFPPGVHVPAEPADHAEDFAHRYAEPLDWLAAIRMEELGIPSERIGSSGGTETGAGD
jgi:hypothetical protein